MQIFQIPFKLYQYYHADTETSYSGNEISKCFRRYFLELLRIIGPGTSQNIVVRRRRSTSSNGETIRRVSKKE